MNLLSIPSIPFKWPPSRLRSPQFCLLPQLSPTPHSLYSPIPGVPTASEICLFQLSRWISFCQSLTDSSTGLDGINVRPKNLLCCSCTSPFLLCPSYHLPSVIFYLLESYRKSLHYINMTVQILIPLTRDLPAYFQSSARSSYQLTSNHQQGHGIHHRS